MKYEKREERRVEEMEMEERVGCVLGVVLRQLKDFSGSFKGCQVIRSLRRKVFFRLVGWVDTGQMCVG